MVNSIKQENYCKEKFKKISPPIIIGAVSLRFLFRGYRGGRPPPLHFACCGRTRVKDCPSFDKEGREQRREFDNPRHLKTRFRSSLNSTAVPNLNCSLVFFFNSFSLYFFEKSTKNMGSCVRHSVLPLLKSRFATSFGRCAPRRSPLVAMLGVARTRFAQTSCHLFPSIARLLAVPPNAALPPPAGNYLLCGIFELPPQRCCSSLFTKRDSLSRAREDTRNNCPSLGRGTSAAEGV